MLKMSLKTFFGTQDQNGVASCQKLKLLYTDKKFVLLLDMRNEVTTPVKISYEDPENLFSSL